MIRHWHDLLDIYINVQILNNIIIIKDKVMLPHAWVTLADFVLSCLIYLL